MEPTEAQTGSHPAACCCKRSLQSCQREHGSCDCPYLSTDFCKFDASYSEREDSRGMMAGCWKRPFILRFWIMRMRAVVRLNIHHHRFKLQHANSWWSPSPFTVKLTETTNQSARHQWQGQTVQENWTVWTVQMWFSSQTERNHWTRRRVAFQVIRTVNRDDSDARTTYLPPPPPLFRPRLPCGVPVPATVCSSSYRSSNTNTI